jgi:hypothetical protein
VLRLFELENFTYAAGSLYTHLFKSHEVNFRDNKTEKEQKREHVSNIQKECLNF